MFKIQSNPRVPPLKSTKELFSPEDLRSRDLRTPHVPVCVCVSVSVSVSVCHKRFKELSRNLSSIWKLYARDGVSVPDNHCSDRSIAD